MRAILTYHSVDDSGSPISISPERFREHVRWLASGCVRVVPLTELDALDGEGDAVALTFDDAFESFATHAAPLLRDSALPATLFVVTDHVGRTNRWAGTDGRRIPEMPLLDWDALGRLAESGVTLGAHGRTHRPLAGIAPGEVHDEIFGSVQALTLRTGVVPTTFAYPYGRSDADTAATVRAAFELGCTTELRPLTGDDDPALMPRLDAFYLRGAGALEGWGTAAFRARIRLRALARRLPRPGRPA